MAAMQVIFFPYLFLERKIQLANSITVFAHNFGLLQGGNFRDVLLGMDMMDH